MPSKPERRRRSGADGRSSNYSDKMTESNVLRILEQQRANDLRLVSGKEQSHGTTTIRADSGYYYDSPNDSYYKCNDGGHRKIGS